MICDLLDGRRGVRALVGTLLITLANGPHKVVAGDSDGDGTGFAQCVIVVHPSGTKYSNEAEWAAAEWEWAMPIEAHVYFVPPQDEYLDPDIWFYDDGAEVADWGNIGAVYKHPPEATERSKEWAIIMLNKFFIAGNRYYTGESCPAPVGGDHYHVRTVFKHEIGHALGLTHAAGGIMALNEGHCDRREGVDRGQEAFDRMVINGLGTCGPLSVDEMDHPPDGSDHGAVQRPRVSFAPNPFNPLTTVQFVVHTAGRARVEVYDARGRLVRELVDAWSESGERSITWDGTDMHGSPAGAGVYLVRLLAGERVTSSRVVLLR